MEGNGGTLPAPATTLPDAKPLTVNQLILGVLQVRPTADDKSAREKVRFQGTDEFPEVASPAAAAENQKYILRPTTGKRSRSTTAGSRSGGELRGQGTCDSPGCNDRRDVGSRGEPRARVARGSRLPC
ncbi:MAG: hypothetical protein U0792_19780 [Gemmataceae bacterium]